MSVPSDKREATARGLLHAWWAQRIPDVPALLCADPARWEWLKAEPEGQNSPEWPIEQVRAAEAAARIFWPLGNTRLEKRLKLIAQDIVEHFETRLEAIDGKAMIVCMSRRICVDLHRELVSSCISQRT